MKIFDREGTPNAARIRIVLAEKALDAQVEFVTIDLIEAQQKAPEFLAMNPIGKTPVLLLDDGLALSECTAITEYLDNLDGNPVLTGRTPREKGVIHMMQRRVEAMVMEPIDDYFHYGTPGLGPVLRPWRKPDWPAANEWGLRRGQEALDNFPYFDVLLQKQPWLAGDSYSLADITLFGAFTFARGIGLFPSSDLAALEGWFERFCELPAVKNRSGQAFRPEDVSRRGG